MELGKRIDEHSENINKELENIKKNQSVSVLNNTITAMNYKLEGINSKLGDIEKCKSDLEDRIMESAQSEQQNESSLRDLWDNIKCTNICIIGVQKEKREKKG